MIEEQKDDSGSVSLPFGKQTVVGSTDEVWVPIPGYEGLYEISDRCRVKSLPKEVLRNKCGVKKIPECIKKVNNSNQLCLFKDKSRKYFCIKKLYMLIFEQKEIKRNKYYALTFDGARPVYTTQRKIVAHAKKKQKTKKCKMTGVSLNTSVGKKYQASIEINKKSIYLGYFEKEIDANEMYRKAERYKYIYNGNPKSFREMLRVTVL
jgi:hypothetical protein